MKIHPTRRRKLRESTMASPPSSTPKSGPLALALHSGSVLGLHQASPLKILHAPGSSSPIRRTSPRFASAARSDIRDAPVKTLPVREPSLAPRRSPRLGTPLPEPESGSLKRKRVEMVKALSDKCLRRSPRFGLASGEVEVGEVGRNDVALRSSSTEPASVTPQSSPRSSGSKAAAQRRAVALQAPRRSPRFSSPVQLPESSSLKRKRAEFSISLSDKCLRRSPRLGLDNVRAETSHPEKNVSASRGSSSKSTPTKLKLSLRSSNSLVSAVDGSNGYLGGTGTSTKGRGSAGNSSILTCTAGKERTISWKCSSGEPLRRSPRLSPHQIVHEAMTKLNMRISNIGKLRSTPRFCTPLTEDQNIKINTNSIKESDKKISKKIKTPSESCMTLLDDKVCAPSSQGNSPLIKTESHQNYGSPRTSLETMDEGLPPAETEVTDNLRSESTEQEKQLPIKTKVSNNSRSKLDKSFFIGDPISEEEARQKWQWRYDMKSQKSTGKNNVLESDDEDEIITDVQCHYRQAKVNGRIYNLGDCATIRGEGEKQHVGKILEFFRTTDGEDYFRVQWFYRAEDTVLQDQGTCLDKKRLFYSTIENDNPMDCIIAKVKITRVTPKFGVKSYKIPPSDFYFDMEYCLEYSSFCTLPSDASFQEKFSAPPSWVEPIPVTATIPSIDNGTSCGTHKPELTLLDLYSGCGGMSTGLHLGAKVSGVNIIMRWAIDYEKAACESLRLNHPETQVRNEAVGDFLQLLKEWEKLCKRYAVKHVERSRTSRSKDDSVAHDDNHSLNDARASKGEFEVSSLVDICYGDPNETGKRGLNFKVRWEGYGPDDDTWEPIEGLSKCQEKIQDFVRMALKSKILPLPGDVDVICGGPPCQGISGYNRYRNTDSPLDDERNRQIIVFMDIVQFLQPKFVLMENVTDILRFDKASLARYALSRLVHMRYQARLGTIAAGSYGLPQFRLRVFLWGAHPEELLPQFPLPTHDVIVRYWPPPEFERNTVAYYEGHPRDLEKSAVLGDAISDLPAVTSYEAREQMSYDKPPETEFQRFIRSSKYEMTGTNLNGCKRMRSLLYDHRPYGVSEDNYLRICQVPKRKGANFRDFPGLIVGADNVVRPDETKEPALLPSGKPIVPDFVFTFEQGKSKRPFGRLWWDETVPTVLTFPDCRNQVALHPEQDRPLTVRECARLQGFPDYYRFCGTIRERYCQIGNAVAVPVSRALGYSLGMAFQKLSGNGPNMILPPKFSYSSYTQLATTNSSAENSNPLT